MNAVRGGLFLLIVSAVSSESEFVADSEIVRSQELPRYVVFPGLDADGEEIAEWNVGFASPFNVFFGPKPYILGWVGEDGFAPGGEEEGEYEEEEVEGEGEEGELEGEEGELEGEDGEEAEEEEEEEVDPDYEYEKL